MCLTVYPQAVRHITAKEQYVQVLWIRIEVPATGDMETLLNCFGEELDRALGKGDSCKACYGHTGIPY